MKSGQKIYRRLLLTGRPAVLIPALPNGELRSLLSYAGHHDAPDETLLAAAIVESAQRFLRKGTAKVL